MDRVEFVFDMRPRDKAELDIVSRVAYLPGIFIGCIHYGAAVSAGGRPDRQKDDFWVHFPLRGNSEMVSRAGSLPCNPKRSVVISAQGHFLRSAPGSERITLSISKATAMTQLAALLGDIPSRRLEFAPEFDLGTAPARRLRRQVDFAIAELDDAGPEGMNPVTLGMYEQLIVTSLLLGQPNNYTAALQRLENKVAPGDVKRAIDFIEAHLQLPVTLTDIVRASGVPGRTLLEHFKDHRSVSPIRYLRNARLARAREALMRADNDAKRYADRDDLGLRSSRTLCHRLPRPLRGDTVRDLSAWPQRATVGRKRRRNTRGRFPATPLAFDRW